MGRSARADWSKGDLVIVPHDWRGDRLLADRQAVTPCRIGAGLRAMYAALLLQPVPPHLTRLVLALGARLEGRDGR